SPSVTVTDKTGFIVVEGNSYYALCEVDSNPDSVITWLHPDGSTTNDHQLEIEHINRNDTGTYTCIAETTFWDGSSATDRGTMDLNVEYSVIVTLIGSEKEVDESATVIVTCTVSCGNPKPFRLELTLDDEVVVHVTNELGITHLEYTILESTAEDTEYQDLGLTPFTEHVYMKYGEFPWEFPRDNICIKYTISDNVFRTVLKSDAWNLPGRKGNTVVAVKMPKAGCTDREDMMKEINLLKNMSSHPNIISLLGCCTISDPIYMITEFMESGDLLNYLRHQHSRTDNMYANRQETTYTSIQHDLFALAEHISNAMAYLEEKGCVHRQLAARNILLNEDKICKLSGFGMSSAVLDNQQHKRKNKGLLPIRWMAIESIFDGVYTSKTDVWSYGVLLWEIFTFGTVPYTNMTVPEVIESLQSGYRMCRPDKCVPELYSVMEQCWANNPIQRPSFQWLTAHLETMAVNYKPSTL
ncbi:tyrosine kinase receptor Cad96Ca-like, partial [Saccoglossus kowalevskii]